MIKLTPAERIVVYHAALYSLSDCEIVEELARRLGIKVQAINDLADRMNEEDARR